MIMLRKFSYDSTFNPLSPSSANQKLQVGMGTESKSFLAFQREHRLKKCCWFSGRLAIFFILILLLETSPSSSLHIALVVQMKKIQPSLSRRYVQTPKLTAWLYPNHYIFNSRQAFQVFSLGSMDGLQAANSPFMQIVTDNVHLSGR